MRLRELRDARGMTQQQVADLAGISQPYYQQIETGKRRANERTQDALAKAFGVPVTSLFVQDDEVTRIASVIALLDSEDRQTVLALAQRLAGSKAE